MLQSVCRSPASGLPLLPQSGPLPLASTPSFFLLHTLFEEWTPYLSHLTKSHRGAADPEETILLPSVDDRPASVSFSQALAGQSRRKSKHGEKQEKPTHCALRSCQSH